MRANKCQNTNCDLYVSDYETCKCGMFATSKKSDINISKEEEREEGSEIFYKIIDFIFSWHIWLFFGLYLIENALFGTSFMGILLSIMLVVLFVASFIGITKFGLDWRGNKRGTSVYDTDTDDVD